MKSKFSISIVLILMVVISGNVFAYDDQVTHRKITEKAIVIANTEAYLIRNLGFPAGLTTSFPSNSGNSIMYLLMEGSKLEDHPACRASNHFHNPLKPWVNAGLGTMPGLICPSWAPPESSARYSALTWATGYDNFNGPIISRNQQQMGWDNARNYYYSALTSSVNTVRENYFVKTFQAVGQALHLLEDMAVPAHVRNDFWNSHVLTGGSNPYELFVSLPENAGLISNLTGTQIESVTPVFTASRLTDFWDATDGSAIVPPQIHDPTIQGTAGLAEYTNANFVSEGTLFSNSTEFTYPKKESTTTIDIDIPDPFSPSHTVIRPYYYKTQDWETGFFLAGVNYTYFYDPEAGSIAPDGIIPPLDNKIHGDYATRLLPRAVGYSAGLLNYFFRGTLEISAPTTTVYAVADGSASPQQFTAIKAKVKNATPNESVGNGTLQAIARYKVVPNYAPDLSNYPPDGTVMQGGSYSYSISASRMLSDPDLAFINIQSTEYIFDFTQNPIPAGITDLTLQVVFKGTLGNEIDSAVAVGMKDISEPAHIVIWNLTDRFSLGIPNGNTYEYHLYDAQTIANTQNLKDLVDFNHNGTLNEENEPYIDAHPSTYWIGFAGADPTTQLPAVAAAEVPAGRHIRLITLADDRAVVYLQLQWQDIADPDGGWTNAFFTSVLNQSDQNGNWQTPTPAGAFRYSLAADGQTHVPISQHYITGLLGCHPMAEDASGNQYCPYTENEAPPVDPTPWPVVLQFP